ncbi:E3 ubiquitin-protein ligase TTC3-like [Contarinia nasturtii]|uniref:E3 ubiquitin-protein ligase TTC3-like n=1 Tax=Contarinia nasturtii TaxID=265458 RepID=UPI0012D45733|nr:E3 ubiquitin-protein ligase TTC3-like [Contarinia nasturtii]
MAVETSEFMLRGLRWNMSIYNRRDWLDIQLSTVENGKILTCETTVTFKLISIKDDAKSIEHVINKKMSSYNFLTKFNFVSWAELFDDQNGFVNDNAIVFEVKIVAEQPDYPGCSGRKRKTANDQNEDAKSPKLECSICLDVIRDQEVSSLRCTHLFCTNCIEDAIKGRKMCPVCNAPAKLTDLRRTRLPFAN